MAAIRRVFDYCSQAHRPVLITFVTAGYPLPESTPDILLGLQEGGADIIELGVPFIDCIADGPTIQESNLTALAHGANVECCFGIVREARMQGLEVPVILMGYYGPIFTYGTCRFAKDSRDAGVNGFIIVDLPYEESGGFREICNSLDLSLIPLIAPSISIDRMQCLMDRADSFVYVLSRVGVTGATGISEANLSHVDRIRSISHNKPLAVGFGVRDKQDFDQLRAKAEAVVVGSRIIEIITGAGADLARQAVKEFCVTLRGTQSPNPHLISKPWRNTSIETSPSEAVQRRPAQRHPKPAGPLMEQNKLQNEKNPALDESYFGIYGGCFVSEVFFGSLQKVRSAFAEAVEDSTFWEDFRHSYSCLGGSSPLDLVENLMNSTQGARIWLKREGFLSGRSSRIHNTLGQTLLAKRMGKSEIVSETAFGQHGLSLATCCALLGLRCSLFIGAGYANQYPEVVTRLKALGASVHVVGKYGGSYRTALNEAMRYVVARLQTCYYTSSTATGPYPIPLIARYFSSAIGREIKRSMETFNRHTDIIVACDRSGIEVVGAFYPFVSCPDIELICVEGFETTDAHVEEPGNSSEKWNIGIFNGCKTYVLAESSKGVPSDQDEIFPHPSMGPEIAHWKDAGLIKVRDLPRGSEQKVPGALFKEFNIEPHSRGSMAVSVAFDIAKALPATKNVVVCIG